MFLSLLLHEFIKTLMWLLLSCNLTVVLLILRMNMLRVRKLVCFFKDRVCVIFCCYVK